KEPRQVTDGCERCGNDSSEHEKRVDSHAAIVYIRLGVEVKRVLATLPKSPETSLGLWRQDVPLCQSVNRQFPVVERVLSVHVFVNFRVLETVTQANDEMVEYTFAERRDSGKCWVVLTMDKSRASLRKEAIVKRYN